MERLDVTIHAKSPLCFSERRPGGQFRRTAGYIPGAVLRGAVAHLMVKNGLADSPEFQALFTSDLPAVFAPAYPEGSFVFPATAMSCKINKGLHSNDRHGVLDILIEQLCFEALEPAGLLYSPHCGYLLPDGKRCGSVLEQQAGFYFYSGGHLCSPKVDQCLLTRVAINRRRAVAEDELLYSPIVLSEGRLNREGNYQPTRFKTTVVAPAVHLNLLAGYLSRIEYLGSGISRGLGQVVVEVDEPTGKKTGVEKVRRQREKMNAAVKEFWSRLQELPGCGQPTHNPFDGAYFTINFHADTVLKKDGWLPVTILDEQMLQHYGKVKDNSLKLVRAYSAYDYRGGWNVALGLPKDVEIVVSRGSVFLFWTQDPERWDKALYDLELLGLGERTAEGFGQVQICDEFHLKARRDDPV